MGDVNQAVIVTVETGTNPSTTYGTRRVAYTDEYSIPPEHRPKPDPLDITNRRNQWTYKSTALRYSRRYEWKEWDWSYPPYYTRYTLCSRTEYSFVVETGIPALPHASGWILAIRNKLQDDKVSFAETIGEWREGVGLLGSAWNTLKRGAKAARDLLKKRNRRRTLKKWFRAQFGKSPDSPLELLDAVSLDLSIKFGLKPTLNQIWDTLDALGHVAPRKRRLQVTVPDKASIEVPGTFGGSLSYEETLSSRCVIWVTYDLDSSLFTAGNLAESLWAGTSLSFVLDWFIDVGGYLSSFNALKGVSSFTGFVSQKTNGTGHDVRTMVSGGVISTAGKIEWKSKERLVLTSLPFADLPTFKLPDTDLWSRLHSLNEMFVSTKASRH
jgi:hypothetical protein